MDRPLVTIVSPVYNQERYVARCVESALSQSYDRWEQLVVDDGSTDRTREIVASYADPRVRLLALPHRGLGALAESYNAALSCSQGSLVGILEGDDLWPAEKLAMQVPLFDDRRVVLTWGRASYIDEAGSVLGHRAASQASRRGVMPSTKAAFRMLTRTNFLVPSVTVMTRRGALDAVGGFRQGGSGLFVDLATWLLVTAGHDGEVAFADHDVGTYRVHAEQTSQRRRQQMAREHWRVVEEVVASLDAEALARVGWDDALRDHARTRGLLAEGEAALLSRDGRTATAFFDKALRLGASTADRGLALLGMASAVLGVNFVSAVFALRERLRS